MEHSNQVRELVLSGEGVTLADVYAIGGEVLMGTARWEKEAEERIEDRRLLAESERHQREMERAEAETNSRIEELQRELEAKRAEMKLLDMEREARADRLDANRATRLNLRGADADTARGPA